MAKTNFQYEKRQRELEKKRKADEKAKRKLEAKSRPAGEQQPGDEADGSRNEQPDEQAADEAGYETSETDTTAVRQE